MSDMDIQRVPSDPASQRAMRKLEEQLKSVDPNKAQKLEELTDKVNQQIGPLEGAQSSKTVEQMRAKLQQEPTDPRITTLMQQIGAQPPVSSLKGRVSSA